MAPTSAGYVTIPIRFDGWNIFPLLARWIFQYTFSKRLLDNVRFRIIIDGFTDIVLDNIQLVFALIMEYTCYF